MSRRWGGRRVRQLAQAVVLMHGITCWLCHQPIDLRLAHPASGSLSVDHVVPRSRGGTDQLANLRPAHLGCNTGRGNRTPDALADRRPHRLGRFSADQTPSEAPHLPISPRDPRKNA